MAYEGGYTSAVNSASLRAQQEAQTALLMQQAMQQREAAQRTAEIYARQRAARAGLGNMMGELGELGRPPEGAVPQPPMPGTGSEPMMREPPPPAQMMGQLMPPPGPGFASPGGPAPMGAMPPPPGPGFATPPPPDMPAPSSPGAPMQGPSAAGAPPVGWKSLPKPPPGMGAPAPAAIGEPPAVMPRQMVSVSDMTKLLKAKGIEGEPAIDMLEAWKPFMDQENKVELDGLKMQTAAQKAAIDAYKASIANFAAETRRSQGQQRIDQKAPLVSAQTDAAKALAEKRRGFYGTGTGPGGASALIDPATVDWYARQSLAGDSSWQVGLARGKVGQQLIAAVKDRIPQLGKEGGMSPEDASAAKGTRDSINSSLRDRQKFVAASNQFVTNFEKQADLVDNYLKAGASGAPPVIAKWIQAGRKAVAGDPDVSALDVAIRGLAREHQRIVTGVTSNAQLHVSAQQTADELLNIAQTPAQVKSILKVMREEATNAREAGQIEVNRLQGELKGLGVPKKPGAAPPGASGAKAQAPSAALTYLKEHPETKEAFRAKFGYVPGE